MSRLGGRSRTRARPLAAFLAEHAVGAKRALLTAGAAVVLLPLLANPEARLPEGPTLGAPWWPGAGALVAGAAWILQGIASRARRDPVTPGPRSVRDVLLLGGLPLYLLYVGNGFLLSTHDNLATRQLPSLILTEGTLDLSSRRPFDDRTKWHYASLWIGDQTLPSFPLGTAFLAVPYTALALGASRGEVSDALLVRWEKHFAALLAVASTLLFFLALRRRAGEGPALATTAVLALATPFVPYASQGLWSTTGETFCFALAFWLLFGREGSVRPAALAGLSMAFAYLCRPSALLPLAALGILLLVRHRRSAFPYAVSAAIGLSLVTAGLWILYDHPLGGYGVINARESLYGGRLATGFLGNLASPSRGAFVWLPYLLFLPLALPRRDADAPLRAWWWLSLAVAAALYALASSYDAWWGGWSIGPRLVGEASLFLALATLPLWMRWRELRVELRAAFLVAVVAAASTQILATYRGPAAFKWNPTVDFIAHPEVFWSWRNSQLAAVWWPGWRYHLDPAQAEVVDASARGDARWHRVDLAPVANGRFDEDPFRPHAPKEWPRFARIDPAALNRVGALFHFAPRGAPNAVTTCRAKQPPAIPIPGLPARRIFAILSAFVTGEDTPGRTLASLEIEYADGSRETLPVRLAGEVFPYAESPRRMPVPRERVYFGDPFERQVLVTSAFEPSRTDAEIVAIRPRNAEARPNEGIVLVALTLELAEGAPRAVGDGATKRS